MVKTGGIGGDDSDGSAPTTTPAPSDKLLADDVEEDAFLLVQLEVIFPSSMPKWNYDEDGGWQRFFEFLGGFLRAFRFLPPNFDSFLTRGYALDLKILLVHYGNHSGGDCYGTRTYPRLR